MKKIIRIVLFVVIMFLPFHGIFVNQVNLPLAAYWKEVLIACTLYLLGLSVLLRDVRLNCLFGKTTFFVLVFTFWIILCALLHHRKASLWGLAARQSSLK